MTETPQIAEFAAVNYLILSIAKTRLWNLVVSVGFHTCDCIMLFDHAWQRILLEIHAQRWCCITGSESAPAAFVWQRYPGFKEADT